MKAIWKTVMMLALTMALLWSTPAAAAPRWVALAPKAAPAPARVDLIKRSSAEIHLRVHTPGVYLAERQARDRRFSVIELPGEAAVRTPGAPELPLVARLVAVPQGARVQAEIVAESDPLALAIDPPWPCQRSGYRCTDARPAFAFDRLAYRDASEQPRVQVSPVMRLGGVSLVRVSVRPFVYDHALGQLRGARTLDIALHIEGGERPALGVSRELARVLDRHVIGWRATLRLRQEASAHLLVLAPASWRTALEPYLAARRAEGVRVSLIDLADENEAQAVQTAIAQAYANLDPPPDRLLLVGDGAQIPPLQGINQSQSDYLYTLLDGEDALPEMMVGRVSVGSAEALGEVLAKWERYRSAPPIYRAGFFFDDALLISSSESYNTGESNINDDTRLDALAEALSAGGYDRITRLYRSDGMDSTADISDALNVGRGLTVYMGHGNGTAWTTTSPDFSNTHVLELQNTTRLPFVMDVSCKNGGFATREPCFAEAWQRGAEGGALAMYSASTDTPWTESAELGAGVVQAFIAGERELGAALLSAMLRLLTLFGDTSEANETLQQYILFGDPLLEVHTRTPQTLALDAPALLGPDAGDLTVSVLRANEPLAGARVLLFADEALLGWRDSDAQGQADLFEFLPVPLPEMLRVAVFSPGDRAPEPLLVPTVGEPCGRLGIAQPLIACEEPLDLLLDDPDSHRLPDEIDQLSIRAGDCLCNYTQVTLSETAADSGRFVGTLADWQQEHQALPLRYSDDTCGVDAASVVRTVSVDCSAPQVLSKRFERVDETSVRLITDTNETARASLILDGREPIVEPRAGNAHTLHIENLQPEQAYACTLTLSDPAGNITTLDGADCAFDTYTQADGDLDAEPEAEEEAEAEKEADADGDADMDGEPEREAEPEAQADGDFDPDAEPEGEPEKETESPAACTPGERRCEGNRLMYCHAPDYWRLLLDCGRTACADGRCAGSPDIPGPPVVVSQPGGGCNQPTSPASLLFAVLLSILALVRRVRAANRNMR